LIPFFETLVCSFEQRVIRKKRFDLLPKKNSLKNGVRQKLRKRKNRADILIDITNIHKKQAFRSKNFNFLNSELAFPPPLYIEDHPIGVPMGWG